MIWRGVLALAAAGLAQIAVAEPVDFSSEANHLCRTIHDNRAPGVMTAGGRAGVAVVAATLGQADISEADRPALAAALAAWRDELHRSAGILSALTPPAALAGDWQVVLDHLAGQAALSQNRLDGLEGRQTIRPAADFGPDYRAVAAAMKPLGFQSRDCELITQDTGVPPEQRDFVSRAAAICTAIVDRRNLPDYRARADLALDTLLRAHGGDLAVPDTGAEAALTALATEWRESHDALAAIPADLLPDATAWQSYLSTFDRMAAVQLGRLAILQSGSGDVSAAYVAAPGPPLPDFDLAALYLDMTDCRGISF